MNLRMKVPTRDHLEMTLVYLLGGETEVAVERDVARCEDGLEGDPRGLVRSAGQEANDGRPGSRSESR